MKKVKLKDVDKLEKKGWRVRVADRKQLKKSLDTLKTQEAYDHIGKAVEIQIMETQKTNELMVLMAGEIQKLNAKNEVKKRWKFTVNRGEDDLMTSVDVEQI